MAELVFRQRSGDEIGVDRAKIGRLEEGLRGTVIAPLDPGYEAARRVWNGVVDRRPTLIARCRDTADVSACLRFAREHDVLLSVRGGGHNVAGRSVCDGGLVIDLGDMREVEVRAGQGSVRIAGGALLSDVDGATLPLGLATPAGVVGETGYGGLTLHGGMGWQLRKRGLAADNVLEAEVVTADAQVRQARPGEHEDLLWAIRGGGGNFGVVTSFTSRLHPMPAPLHFGVLVFASDDAPVVLRALRDLSAQAPDELGLLSALWTAPDEGFVEPEHRGRPALFVLACYLGAPEDGERLLRPLREVRPAIADRSSLSSFAVVQRFFDADYPRGRRYYWKSTFVAALDDGLVDRLVAQSLRRPSPLTSIDLWPLGGAFARVGATDTPFGERGAGFMVNYESNWLTAADDGANVDWARQCLREIAPWSAARTYLNFAGFAEEGERMLRESYGANYERLRAIKARYDPDNVLRSNFNIAPAA